MHRGAGSKVIFNWFPRAFPCYIHVQSTKNNCPAAERAGGLYGLCMVRVGPIGSRVWSSNYAHGRRLRCCMMSGHKILVMAKVFSMKRNAFALLFSLIILGSLFAESETQRPAFWWSLSPAATLPLGLNDSYFSTGVTVDISGEYVHPAWYGFAPLLQNQSQLYSTFRQRRGGILRDGWRSRGRVSLQPFRAVFGTCLC